MSVPKMSKKTYIINGKKYYLPEETTLEQYEEVMKLLADADINISIDAGKGDIKNKKPAIDIVSIVRTVLGSGKVAPFLTIVLVPENEEYWRPEFMQNIEDMKRTGDKTFVEVIKDFFYGKTDLIVTIMQHFAKLVTEKTELIQNIPGLDNLSQNESKKPIPQSSK